MTPKKGLSSLGRFFSHWLRIFSNAVNAGCTCAPDLTSTFHGNPIQFSSEPPSGVNFVAFVPVISSSGLRYQREVRKQLEEITGTKATKFTPLGGSEENWIGLPWKVEVKSGALFPP